MIRSSGNPVTDAVCVPGRFAIYRSDGSFRLVPMARATQGGLSTAVFITTTFPGEQVTGNLTRFDVPMWLTAVDCRGNPADPANPVIFPGRWSEGPSEVALPAP